MNPDMFQHRSWGATFRAFADRRVMALLFLGFSAGVPILLVFSTLSVWLRDAEVSRATIGFFSWAALGYAFKFVWAPVIDKLPVPGLTRLMGRRRSWLLISQIAIMASLVLLATNDPGDALALTAAFAVLLGFSSATQDVVIDAYRIEAADRDMQGLMSATYIAGYRIGMLVAGAGALEIAGAFEAAHAVGGYDFRAWSNTYLVMAGVMLVGLVTTFAVSEPVVPEKVSPETESQTPRTAGGHARLVLGFVAEAYIAPFRDFFQRYGRTALLILALIATYRIADVMMGVMANVFYVDLGFSKQEIGRITKGFGLVMTIFGGFLGGALTMRYGVMRTLFLGAVLAAATNLLFAVLADTGNDIRLLMAVISADNLSAGIASAAFVAYLSGLTHSAFTASQYALFSSLMLVLPKLLAGYSGVAVDALGYGTFFVATAALGLPVLVLIWLVSRTR